MYRKIIKSNEELYYVVLNNRKFYIKKNKITVNDFNKEHTKFVVSLCSAVVMTIFFAISLYYNLMGGLPFGSLSSYTNMLGRDCVVKINNFGASCVALNFDGSVINDMEYNQKITASVSSNIFECNLRAKAYISYLEGTQTVDIYGYTNWQTGEDEYIYFNQRVLGGESVGVCLYVKMPQEMLFDSNKIYILTIIVEAF